MRIPATKGLALMMVLCNMTEKSAPNPVHSVHNWDMVYPWSHDSDSLLIICDISGNLSKKNRPIIGFETVKMFNVNWLRLPTTAKCLWNWQTTGLSCGRIKEVGIERVGRYFWAALWYEFPSTDKIQNSISQTDLFLSYTDSKVIICMISFWNYVGPMWTCYF